MLIWHDGSSRNDECAPVDLFIQVTSHSVRSFSLLLPGPANPRSLRDFSSFRRWPLSARSVLSS